MFKKCAQSDPSWEQFSDKRRDPPKTDCIYRVGPAPREDTNAGTESAPIGMLDSDLDGYVVADTGGKSKKSKRAAGSKALIIYFAKMAGKGSKETIDYQFLDSLFKSGANVNCADKHGQTVLHEVARNWNVDVAKYFIQKGADINKGDSFGRTPLHLCAAVNHVEMVEFLIINGAYIHARTTGELQTPIHYAAKYNAVGSCKMLLQHGAGMNDRDYRRRTPIFIAAEMAREDSVRYLVDIGVPVGTFDDTGMSTISHMVEKMPHIAVDALDQYLLADSAFRKEYYYLNFLEYNPAKWREENVSVDEYGVPIVLDKMELKKRKKEKKTQCVVTPLKLAVQLEEFDVIMHPVMQQLIKEKWNKFGKWGAIIDASIHLIYILIWTMLGIFLPNGTQYYSKPRIYWSILFEVLGVLMTLYFLLHQIWERKVQFKEQKQFRMWRTRQLNRDTDFCHPRWEQEKTFLESEMKAVRSRNKGILADPWNIFDFLTFGAVLLVICTRFVSFFSTSKIGSEIHHKSFAFALIFMWLHFMKSCRPFTTLGPFITMLGHVIADTVTFGFLFFEFFIPYAVGFWILFGGPKNAAVINKAGGDDFNAEDWELFNNLLYSTWQVTLNVDFNFAALLAVDRLMAQVMVGTFFALSTVLCLNLYIALLSETFNRVYQNAKANASLLQAYTVCQIEKILTKKKYKEVFDYIQDDCGPLVVAQAQDPAGFTEDELWRKVIRAIIVRLDQFADFVKGPTTTSKAVTDQEEAYRKLEQKYNEDKETYDLYQILMARDKELYQLRLDIFEMRRTLLEHFGEEKAIPPKPKYIPPPDIDIKPPAPLPKYISPVPQVEKFPGDTSAGGSLGNRQSNAIFRNIMESKSADGIDELQQQDEDNALLLSGSWEDIPPTEFSGDFDDEYGDSAS